MPRDKSKAFRCPEDLLDAIEARRLVTQQSFSAVVIEALRQLLDPVHQQELIRQITLEVGGDEVGGDVGECGCGGHCYYGGGADE